MEKKQMNKKGVLSLAQVGPVVIVLLTIGIVLSVGLLILADIETQVSTTTADATVNNETQSGVVVNVSFPLDSIGSTVNFLATDLASMINNSGGLITAGNYTFNTTGPTASILMTNTTNLFDDGIVNFSYTFTETEQDFAFNGSREAQRGVDTIASFQSIFGIVIAAAVILGLVALFR